MFKGLDSIDEHFTKIFDARSQRSSYLTYRNSSRKASEEESSLSSDRSDHFVKSTMIGLQKNSAQNNYHQRQLTPNPLYRSPQS